MSDTNDLVVQPHRAKTEPALLGFNRASSGIVYASAADAVAVADLMARSGIAVRKHLRNNTGACLSVVMLSVEWGMSPYLVGNKTYEVNDQLAFEAQLVQAVITMRAPIKGRIKTEYSGAGFERQIKVWAKLKVEAGEDEEVVEYISPMLKDIKPQNSPLWKNDPDQQLHYYGARAFCRRHFPEILMGIYTPDEIAVELPNGEYRVMNEGAVQEPRQQLASRLDNIAQQGVKPTETVDPATGEVTEAPKKPRAPRGSANDIAMCSLVIVDGIVFKSIGGEENREATDDEYEKAELIYLDGKIKTDRRPKKPAPEAAKADPAPAKQPEPVAAPKAAPTPAEALADDGLGDDLDSPQPEPEKPKRDPIWDRLDTFKADCLTADSDLELENLKKRFKGDFPGTKKGDDIFNEAQAAYSDAAARIRNKPAPETAAASDPAPDTASTGGNADDEERLERMISHDLDHAPRGIDMSDVEQVEGYIKGVKAGRIGRPESTVPMTLSEAGAAAWKTGHAYGVQNPAEGA